MKKYIQIKTKDKSAQALPEFVLCMPLIMLMIGILITMAQMLYAKQVVQAAAQVGCRTYVTKEGGIPDFIVDNYPQALVVYSQEKANQLMRSAGMALTTTSTTLETFPLDGTGYEYAECRTEGGISTIFPIQWNNRIINANVTFIRGYCAMVKEF